MYIEVHVFIFKQNAGMCGLTQFLSQNIHVKIIRRNLQYIQNLKTMKQIRKNTSFSGGGGAMFSRWVEMLIFGHWLDSLLEGFNLEKNDVAIFWAISS